MKLAIAVLCMIPLLVLSEGCKNLNADKMKTIGEMKTAKSEDYIEKAKEAKKFCDNRNYNNRFFILIDLGQHSGVERFFVWDFNQNKIAHSFLVSHGCCDNPWGGDNSKNNVETSNVSGSHCSSEGKFLIGQRGYSNWGINVKYLMHGLEASNKNALDRQIVFHGWDRVTDYPVYPRGTVEGWGCPAISNSAMKLMDNKIKNEKNKKILMWIIK